MRRSLSTLGRSATGEKIFVSTYCRFLRYCKLICQADIDIDIFVNCNWVLYIYIYIFIYLRLDTTIVHNSNYNLIS